MFGVLRVSVRWKMRMEIDDQVSDREWDPFVATYPAGHVLQTSGWAAHKSEFGWQVERVVVRNRGAIVAGAQVLFRRLGLTIAYVPKGPLVDLANGEVCSPLFDALHRKSRARRAILLKIEPDLAESPALTAQLAGYGFRPGRHTIQPKRTLVVDITGSPDAILERMKSKTRYNIRLSERKGVRVRKGEREDMESFTRLMAITGERDSFGVHSPAYYERAYDLLVSAGMGRLFVATYQERPVAGIMVFTCGSKAWYMYGASGNEHREKMPTYALQWAAICWAKERGCHTYDLWGVPDEDEETLEAHFTERSGGLWGVYRFKRGFGGQLARYAGAFDYVYSKPLYWLYHLALKMR